MNPAPMVSPLVNLVPALFLFLIMYFLLIRPQRRQQQEHTKMVAGLRKHDEVVTTGGIHGVIVNLKEDTVTLRVDDTAKLDVDKQAIARLIRRVSE